MALPGFTAEASVGPTTQVYRLQDRYGTAEPASVYRQLDGSGEDFGAEDLAEEALETEGEEDAEIGDEV